MLLKLFRVKDWLHFLGLPLLGYVIAGPRGDISRLAVISLVASLYLGYGYSLNEIFDKRESNKRLEECPFGFLGVLAVSLGMLSLSIAIILLFAPFNKKETIPILLIGSSSAYLYSAPPFRFKGLPFLDLIFNSLCFAPLVLIGAAIPAKIGASSLLFAGYIFILMIPVQLVHEIDHYYSDRRDNIHNTVCSYGLGTALKILKIAILPVFFYSIGVQRWLNMSIFFPVISGAYCISLYAMTSWYVRTKAGGDLKKNIRILSAAYALGMLYLLLIK